MNRSKPLAVTVLLLISLLSPAYGIELKALEQNKSDYLSQKKAAEEQQKALKTPQQKKSVEQAPVKQAPARKKSAPARKKSAQRASAVKSEPQVTAGSEEPVKVLNQAAPIVETFKDCESGCPEMVVVPSGNFMMGSPESEARLHDYERPQHQVTIGYKLAVGKYEVTRGEFARFVQDSGYRPASDCSSSGRNDAGWENPGYTQESDHPVACVNWNDAQAYVKWLNQLTGKVYRLLSESEWEYVARAGSSGKYSWGEDWADACLYGNHEDRVGALLWLFSVGPVHEDCPDGSLYTRAVGQYKANGFGLYDLTGNVWEWVEDCYHESYSGSPADGSAWTGCGNDVARVLRGGSWINDPYLSRSANRNWSEPIYRFNFYGFRLARRL